MAAIFQLRRGTTGSKPTLASGEFYMDTDTESLYLGIDNAGDEIVLAKLNDSNAGNFVIAGNLTVGGTITAPIITAINTKFATIEGQSGSWVGGNTDITLLNTFTSSQDTKNSTLQTYTASVSTKFDTIETQSGSWITESETSSFFVGATVSSNTITFTKGNGTTADVTVTGGTSTDISALNQHSSSINSYTSSQNTKNTTLENVTSSLISFTGSVNSRLTNIESTTASLNTKFSTLATQSGSWLTETESGSFLINASVSTNTITFTKGDNTTFDVTVAGGGSVPTGTISGSAQITAFGFVSGSYETTGRGIFSGSSQITGFETTGRGIISGAAQLPTGIISGAAQLPSGLISGAAQLPNNLVSASTDTATIDITITAGTISAVAIGGIVSGSSQLTGALDLRYVRTGSFNSFTQSIYSWTSSTDIRIQAISDLTGAIGSGGSSPISSTGTSLKSDTPLTSNVSTTNGIFFGKNAGKDSTAAARSIFLGEGAGNAATNANDSIFIGSGSGENAANATYSTMLGYNAGFGATNAGSSIFIGANAGATATDAAGAIFLGDSAGYSANNANGAFFVGGNAGWAADNAIYSNFIGNLSGQAQTNAAYSNLIGYRTGYVFPGSPGENLIGPNNIIIGTGITLQNGRQDSINIGGLIFGTGSYDGSTTQGFSGSANGKVGINISLPQAELHVSGSGIYTGTLTASLSEGYVWAGGVGNISKLVATSSFGGGGGSTDISALNTFTASILGTNVWTASINEKFNTIGTQSGSWGAGGSTDITALNTFTSSANSRLNNLELDSASQDNRLDNLESFTSSIDTTIKNKLNAEAVLSGSAQITAFGFISGSTIQTSGSSIYSTNPATSNFSQTDGVFIGYEAGINSTAGDKSVFVGYQAGWGAANAYHSNFIGQTAGFQASGADRSNFIGSQAGDGATNARFSNFIGFNAGYGQTAASYSNVFGYRAGYTNTLGSNNIIIGTNITFENNRKDSINLGGVIFATGSHSNTLSSPFAGAVTDGKVGINISLPQAALHVSGAAILTNTFTASLSEGYTWVGGAGNVTTLVATSSFGGGSSTDITLLNQHTASINTYTGSVNSRLNNLELFTGSTNSRLNAIESVSGAWITESETGSFELRGNNIVSASSDTTNVDITITAGVISADLKGGVVSSSAQIIDILNPINSFTQSLLGTNTWTASINEKFNTIETQSGSWGAGTPTDITLLNQHSASLNTYTGSANSRFTNIELFTASANSRLNAIENVSGTWVTEAETASFFTNASVNLNTITFTKGNGTTQNITVDTGSLPAGLVSGSSQVSYLGITDVPQNIVSGAAQIVPLLPTGTVSGSSQVTGITNGQLQNSAITIAGTSVALGSSISLATITGGSGILSGSGQLGDYETTGRGIVSGSSQIVPLLPTGTVSGSSQVSYLGLSNIPVGIVSGAVQVLGGSGVFSSSAQITGFETTGRGIVSSSTQVIELLPVGTVSGSAQVLGILSSLNSYTQSNDTTNTNQNNRLTEIENYTSSLKNAIGLSGTNVTVFGDLTVNGTTTQINSTQVNIGENILELNYGGSAATAGIYAKDATGGSTVSGSLLWDSSTDLWIAGKKGSEAKVLTDGMGVISGSGQLGDYETTGRGIISSSAQITAFGFVSGSYVTTSSFNNYTASISTASLVSRLDAIESVTSSLNTYTASANSRFTNIELFTASANSRLNAIENVSGTWVTSNITGSSLIGASAALNVITFTKGNNTTFNLTIDTGSFGLPAGVVSGSSQVISILDSLNTYTQSNDVRWTNLTNQSGSWITESETSSFETTGRNIVSSSAQITALGFISSSVTASLLTTASIVGTTLTFTKGDNSTFGLQIATASLAERANQVDILVKNVSGAQIDKGKVVRISGATGDNPLVVTASFLTEGQSANTLGITTQNIPNDSFGYVLTEGILLQVNTTGMNAGELLYLGANGTFTTTPPTAPNHGVRLGEVLRGQQNNGSIYVRVDNGSELGEAHDVVDSTTNASIGDILMKSGSVWINNSTFSSSVNSRLNAIESVSNSWVRESETGSFYVAAGYDSEAQLLHFTDATGSVDSVDMGSLLKRTDTGSLLTTASAAGNTITFTKGDSETFSVTVSGGTLPAGTISGSSQLTSSFDGRYVLTGSFDTLSASVDGRLDNLESFTSSIDTTIKNKLNAETVVSSSAQITSLGFISSSANTGFVVPTFNPLPTSPETGSMALSASVDPGDPGVVWIFLGPGKGNGNNPDAGWFYIA